MGNLTNKRILLGLTGGIAAYKSAELVRRLQDVGAQVRVVMTPAAQEFITPLTLQALSGQPVHTSLLDPAAEAAMGHIELARWGDLLLVAPASADFLARVTHGHANDLLSTLWLAARCPLAVAPAMNQAMWAAAATQANIHTLASRGVHIWGPDAGSQACGDVGPGRMLEVPALVAACAQLLQPSGALNGRRVLITAGPTREALDPVRYITNHSSGKMGYALAAAAHAAGAAVCLISGPVTLATPAGVERIDVVSALDMHAEVMARVSQSDIFIGTAAVADFRAADAAEHKIKKVKSDSGSATEGTLTLTLVENPDIIAAVARHAQRPFTVGFAAETRAVEEYGRDKLNRKQLDMVVANDVSQAGIGFNSDDNAATLIWSDGSEALGRMSKTEMAQAIIATIAQRLN